MRKLKAYNCLKIHEHLSGNLILEEIRPAEAHAWHGFTMQARRWIRLYYLAKAEQLFIQTYLPEAKIIPEEERGLTNGMVFAYKGTLYWDEGYQLQSFLERLLNGGLCILQNQGEYIE